MCPDECRLFLFLANISFSSFLAASAPRAPRARARISPPEGMAILPALLSTPLDSTLLQKLELPPIMGDSPSFLRRGTRVPRCKESGGAMDSPHTSLLCMSVVRVVTAVIDSNNPNNNHTNSQL